MDQKLQRRTWLKNPLAILAAGADGGVVIAGSRIIELVAAGASPSMPVHETVDVSRHVVLPGLVNTHHHFFQNLTRAHPAALNKPLFAWLAALYPTWERIDAEAFRLACRIANVELLLSGCTTTSDHHYMYPPGLEYAVDIAVEEAHAVGIRSVITRGSMSDYESGVTPRNLTQTADAILGDSQRVIELYHDRSDGAMVQIALAPCSPFNVTKDLMRQTARLAADYGCRLHTHCGETHDEIAYCQARFQQRPLEYLNDAGWLGPQTWLAHGIHFTDAEIVSLGAAGVSVAHCPTSNMVLASGSCRTRELEDAGVTIGLGVDGSASNDNSNLIEAARLALMLNRLSYGAQAITHLDVLRWATVGSSGCLGRSDIGSLEVGKQADLALFTLDEVRFSGSHDPLAALILCGAHRADRVMVAGRWRVVDGSPVDIDLNQLQTRHTRAANALRIE